MRCEKYNVTIKASELQQMQTFEDADFLKLQDFEALDLGAFPIYKCLKPQRFSGKNKRKTITQTNLVTPEIS